MGRRAAVFAGGLVLALAPMAIPAASASGGGGCAPPITSAQGATVIIRNYCFEPTVVHVRPGATVTWRNEDVSHTVTGANRAWGSYRDIKTGRAAAWRFDRPGVYPYYCVLHVGMVGTVVVGDANAAGPADDLSRRDVRRVSVEDAVRTSQVATAGPLRATEPQFGVAPAVASLVAGLAVAVGAGRLVRRRVR